jgi:DNA-binding NtrC family response regulator
MTEKSVLIVDDETVITETLEKMFLEFDYSEIRTAQTMKEGLSEFKLFNPILVLTDLRLYNNIGGVHLCEEIKKIAPLTIVVSMSGMYDSSYSLSYLRRHGFDHMIPKPFNIDEIRQIANCAYNCRETWDTIARRN